MVRGVRETVKDAIFKEVSFIPAERVSLNSKQRLRSRGES